MQEKVISTNKLLWDSTKGRRIFLLLYIIVIVLRDFISLYLAQYLFKILVDSVINNRFQLYDGMFFIFILAILTDITIVMLILRHYFIFKSLNFIKKNLRNLIFEYSVQHSMKYFNDSFSGSLTNKVTIITDKFLNILKYMHPMTNFVIFFIAIPIFLLKFSIILPLIFVSLTLIYSVTAFLMEIKMTPVIKEKAESQSKYFGLINDSFTNIGNIKIFNGNRREVNRIKRQNFDILRKTSSLLYMGSRISFLTFVYMFLLMLSTLVISIIMLMENSISLGDFLFICTITSLFVSMCNRAVDTLISTVENFNEIENAVETLFKPIEIKNRTNSKKLKVSEGKLIFKNITFEYRNEK